SSFARYRRNSFVSQTMAGSGDSQLVPAKSFCSTSQLGRTATAPLWKKTKTATPWKTARTIRPVSEPSPKTTLRTPTIGYPKTCRNLAGCLGHGNSTIMDGDFSPFASSQFHQKHLWYSSQNRCQIRQKRLIQNKYRRRNTCRIRQKTPLMFR